MDVSQRDALLKSVLNDDGDEVLRHLSSGASISADPRHGDTPMRIASMAGALSSLRALLQSGASANERITYTSPVDRRVEQDFTPIFYARSPEVIDLLVEFGADVNAVSASGLSPLMRFAHFGRADLVAALLRHGADATSRQHMAKGRKARNALEVGQDALAYWESLPREGLKPEAVVHIDACRRTVALLLEASAP